MHPYASPSVGAGVGFGCAIDGQGAVLCWGDNTYGQAGSTPSSAAIAHPQPVSLVPTSGADGGAVEAGSTLTATALALGDHHACAVTSTQAVYCWGLNDAYQLGHASASSGLRQWIVCPPGSTVALPTPRPMDSFSGSDGSGAGITRPVTRLHPVTGGLSGSSLVQ